MILAQNVINFNKKLELLACLIKETYRIKKEITLSINNCTFKVDGNIVVQHPDFPDITLVESDLDDLSQLKANILSNIELNKKKKRVYEAKWEIDYWLEHTSPEYISNRLNYIELLRLELNTLSDTVPIDSVRLDFNEKKERRIKALKTELEILERKS